MHANCFQCLRHIAEQSAAARPQQEGCIAWESNDRLCVSAAGKPPDSQHAHRAGAYDFIAKPYDIPEMTARIHNMLEVHLLYKFLDEQARLQQNTSVVDPLTGLPSRRLAMARVAAALEHARRRKTMMALLCVDIDRFRLLNDQQGRGLGDGLLKAVAARLAHRMRREDTVARIGDNVFLVVLPDIKDLAAAARPARKSCTSFPGPSLSGIRRWTSWPA
jgi:PleD family two-component response regulator